MLTDSMTAATRRPESKALLRNRRLQFNGLCALAFVGSVAATIHFCRSMGGDMEMPGGWTMSMVWMRMPEQTWAGAAASFVGMWIVMMMAMMLPSLVPMLSRYREAVGR